MRKFSKQELVGMAKAHFSADTKIASINATEDGHFFSNDGNGKINLGNHCRLNRVKFFEITAEEAKSGKADDKGAKTSDDEIKGQEILTIAKENRDNLQNEVKSLTEAFESADEAGKDKAKKALDKAQKKLEAAEGKVKEAEDMLSEITK